MVYYLKVNKEACFIHYSIGLPEWSGNIFTQRCAKHKREVSGSNKNSHYAIFIRMMQKCKYVLLHNSSKAAVSLDGLIQLCSLYVYVMK